MLSILAPLALASKAKSRKAVAQSSSGNSSSAANTSSGPWRRLGTADSCLLEQMEAMYWGGVKREMLHILLTLRKWQQPEYASTVLADEEDDHIHGYDTFLDQISESGRVFADRYQQRKEAWKKGQRPSYGEALQQRAIDILLDQKSIALRQAVRSSVAVRKKYDIQERRARMLLQSAGFLDIDKLIEYRPPEELVTFWKRPVAPQLTFSRDPKLGTPEFSPLYCHVCHEMVRGISFENATREPALRICEECYRKDYYGSGVFSKCYKHSVLHDSISPEAGQKLCLCTSVSRIDSDGRARVLFPADEEDSHRGAKNAQVLKCGLISVKDAIADTKYQGMLSSTEKPMSLGDQEYDDKVAAERREERAKEDLKKGRNRVVPLQNINEKSLIDGKSRVAETGQTTALDEEEADEDVPFFLRKFANRYPFGNVHMALRFGPLIIENGVRHTQKGAVISSRDPPCLQVLRDSDDEVARRLALSDGAERTLWCQTEKNRAPKRYKAVMKQVVGGAFAGMFNESLEDELVRSLMQTSRRNFEKSPADEDVLLGKSVDKLVSIMRRAIGPRVAVYLRSLAEKLLDQKTVLQWNFRTNNCQNFCDALLDQRLFGSIVAPFIPDLDESRQPLYLFSFVCRPGSYVKDGVNSKFDVPSGLTEEYLLKFRYGRHEESDIIDVLQEYWHDWGNFGGTIYKYQDLFPWDCTEAFRGYPGKCNGCNISKHVWAFPFDSLSIISLHLAKDRHFYPPTHSASSPTDAVTLSDKEWMQNRLKLLIAQDVLLAGALAMVRTPEFCKSVAWLSAHPDQRRDRLKLGGIHRAQPFSHAFDLGRYRHYFIADWAHLKREHQVRAYELLRDGRVRMPNVPGKSTKGFDDDDNGAADSGCGGDAFFMAAACAGGCAAQCGGGGASGTCATAGGGDGGGGDGGGDAGGCASCAACGGGGCGGE